MDNLNQMSTNQIFFTLWRGGKVNAWWRDNKFIFITKSEIYWKTIHQNLKWNISFLSRKWPSRWAYSIICFFDFSLVECSYIFSIPIIHLHYLVVLFVFLSSFFGCTKFQVMFVIILLVQSILAIFVTDKIVYYMAYFILLYLWLIFLYKRFLGLAHINFRPSMLIGYFESASTASGT